MKMLNQVKITFAGRSVNEGFARAALAAFLVQLRGRDQLHRPRLPGQNRPHHNDGGHL